MKHRNTHGFSIIEVLVGIFIFSLGLVSIFMLLTSALNLNELNKNKIIASNLAREQIELFRNIRDTNYQTLHNWNQIDPTGSVTNRFSTGSYYTIENNLSSGFHIETSQLSNFGEGVGELEGKMSAYRLYRTPEGIYTYKSTGNTPTHFYRYLHLVPVQYGTSSTLTIPSSFRVISKVIWYKRGYHEFQIDTIVADWRRI